MSQKPPVLRLKVLPWPGIEDCGVLEKSHRRNSSRRCGALSLVCTSDLPQRVHLHLCLPEEVNPFLFMGAEQMGHSLVFMGAAFPGGKTTPTF